MKPACFCFGRLLSHELKDELDHMHPNEEKKRAEERAIFAEFLRRAPWANIGKSDFRNGAPGNEPDIIAQRFDEQIGIEITGIDSPSLRSQESAELKLIDLSRKRYEALGGPPVTVHIYGLTQFERKQTAVIAEALASLVLANPPELGHWHTIPWDGVSLSIANAIDSLSVARFESESFWQAGKARFVPPFSSLLKYLQIGGHGRPRGSIQDRFG